VRPTASETRIGPPRVDHGAQRTGGRPRAAAPCSPFDPAIDAILTERLGHALLEPLGFRCEARMVDADWFKGEWTTLRVYAVLGHEWRSAR
jgi:hypothetical protein